MLAEQFIASVGVPNQGSGNVSKDVAIFTYQFQPLLARQQVLKNSVTLPQCLAVSATHIFAAQADKAVVHVYSRGKGNQEAIVPFTERITCIHLVCDDTVLVLGTTEGRIIFWEIASGRQVSTSQAHLQAVTTLACDGTGNFLLSASKDATVHVWSIFGLLSFANAGLESPSPTISFSSHRSEVVALVLGRSAGFANIAVTASSDKTCLIWDYHTNAVLRTYLLPAVPTCLDIDAAERAVYVGYEDGCIQKLDLYSSVISSADAQSLPQQISGPIQPPSSSLWRPPDKSSGATLSMSISFDGCTILSGHESGAILSWDIGRKGLSSTILQAPLPGPVTNLQFFSVTGFAVLEKRTLQVPSVVKPKFGAFDNANGTVPSNYALAVQFPSDTSRRQDSAFVQALLHSSVPNALLDDGLRELANWNKGGPSSDMVEQEEAADFMALDEPTAPRDLSVEEQNSILKAELDALRRLQQASFAKLEKLSLEKRAFQQREDKRIMKKSLTATKSHANGTTNGDVTADYSSSSDD